MKLYFFFSLIIIGLAQAKTTTEHPFAPQDDSQEERNRLWNRYHQQQQASTEQAQPVFSNNGLLNDSILTAKRKPLDPELRDLVIEMSTDRVKELAQRIQECAQDYNKKCPPRALLEGEPGVGKTTYIQAVAERAGIPFIQINAPFVADKYKDSGPENLKAIFKDIVETKIKIILVFDELHCLTDGHKNSNDPNPNTAAAFWKLLDQCAENPNIILVGILNNSSNMPMQIKSRFENHTYIMKSSDSIEQKKQILYHYLKKFKHNCDEKCQKSMSKSLKTAEARAIQGIVESADGIASLGKREWQITQQELEIAIKRWNEDKEAQKKEPDQATKTLIAQERAANATTVNQYTNAVVVGTGATGAIIVAVEKKWGWAKVWEKTQGGCIHLGKIALVITKHTVKAGADYCIDGKIPNPKKIIQDMVKDEIFKKVKVSNDKEQK